MTRLPHAIRDAGLTIAARVSPRVDDAGTTILVLQPDHLGDILLSQPAVRLLRRELPDTRLVGVVGPWSAEVARMAWPVDDIVTIPFPGFIRTDRGDPTAPYRLLPSAAVSLRKQHPAAAIVLRPDAWWAAWLASLVAPQVVTADDPRARRFATRQMPVDDEAHAVLRAAQIAAGWVGGAEPAVEDSALRIAPSADAATQARSLLHSAGVDGPYAVLHPGSGAAVKLWSGSHWRQVAAGLRQRGMGVVVTGSNAEADLCEAIADGTGAISVAGRTPLRVLLEILRGSTIAVGTDNGPMHLAVAAGTPTVHLFGPSDPGRYGPWGDPRRHRVVSAGWRCPRCGDLGPDRAEGCGCMLAITPGAVWTAIDEVLDAHGPS